MCTAMPAEAEESVVQELRGDYQWPVIDVALYGAAGERQLDLLSGGIVNQGDRIAGCFAFCHRVTSSCRVGFDFCAAA